MKHTFDNLLRTIARNKVNDTLKSKVVLARLEADAPLIRVYQARKSKGEFEVKTLEGWRIPLELFSVETAEELKNVP
ncbi:MAG: hypothetical protein H0W58_07490 [Acidobacteria bacterium]|jgi:hypothetical protein|nr:hypothetical protein [Acidobacteriota bacterium]